MTQALTALPSLLGPILNKVAQLSTLTALLQPVLPTHLQSHCQVANWRRGVLVIAVNNGMFASELRFRTGEIVEALRQQGLYTLTSLRIIVLPKLQTKILPSQKTCSGSTVTALHQLTQSLLTEPL